MEAFLLTWLPLRPYLLFPPESATLQERVIFVSNLETLLGHLRNQSSPAPVLRSLQPSPHLIQRVLKIVFETYREPDLSLETISRMLAISKRHLYRKWKESFDQSFSEYLSDFRMEKAARIAQRIRTRGEGHLGNGRLQRSQLLHSRLSQAHELHARAIPRQSASYSKILKMPH